MNCQNLLRAFAVIYQNTQCSNDSTSITNFKERGEQIDS